jgi:hypothetical protein
VQKYPGLPKRYTEQKLQKPLATYGTPAVLTRNVYEHTLDDLLHPETRESGK